MKKTFLMGILIFSMLFSSFMEVNYTNNNVVNAEEINLTDVMFIVSNSDNTPNMEELDFEITEVGGEFREVVKSNFAMISLKLKNGSKYIIKLLENSNYELSPLEFTMIGGVPTLNDGNSLIQITLEEKKNEEKPKDPQILLDSITINVVKDAKALSGISFNLMKWESNLPNLISRHFTDELGKLVLSNLDADADYELLISNTTYKFDNGKINFSTDENGKIKSINGKRIISSLDGIIKISAVDMGSNELGTARIVFKVLDKLTKKPIPNVEFTINTVEPKLKSYKRAMSNENGDVIFELEGQKNGKIYALTLSKNQQFLWDFSPEEITFVVDENLNVNYITPKVDFLLVKNDRTYMFNELRKLIERGELLLGIKCQRSEELQKLLNDLSTSVDGAKLELSKESIPYYIQGFIDELKNKIGKVETYLENGCGNSRRERNNETNNSPNSNKNEDNNNTESNKNENKNNLKNEISENNNLPKTAISGVSSFVIVTMAMGAIYFKRKNN